MNDINCPICETPEPGKWLEKNNHSIYQCKGCGAGFVHPTPNNLEKIYSQDYFFNPEGREVFGYADYDADKEPMRKVFSGFLGKLEKETSGRRILDFGAATGFFLDRAKERGWQTAGLEISEFAAKEAARRGHRMFHDLSQAEGKFSAVTLWDVLEHLPDPKSELRKVNAILEDGGLLAINTIDRGSVWAKLLGSRWQLILPPEHLFYFTKKSLIHLLEEIGFEMIESDKPSKSFALPYIFKTLYNWQKLRLWHYLAQKSNHGFWRQIAIPINLRDNIFVLARKK